MPQKLVLAPLLLCAALARADDLSAQLPSEENLYASYRVHVSDRDQLALWGSLDAPDAFLEFGCVWTRENLELSLVFANVLESESTPGIPRSLSARVKYSF